MKIQSSPVHRFFQRTAQFMTGVIQDQVESWSSAYSVEPSAGPAQQEYRLKKILKQNQLNFGKDSIYLLSTHASLARHYQERYLGMQAAEHYGKALQVFEQELQQRGEVASLHKLVPACLGSGQDAASLYEQAADFFQLYGGAPKSLPLLQRAQELVAEAPFPRRAEIDRKLARIHLDTGNLEEATRLYEKLWEGALEHFPANSEELGGHAEELARCLGQGKRADDFWGLSISLHAQNRSATALSSLAKQYSSLGHPEQARVLRERAELLQLEDRVRGAPSTRLLKQDLQRLIVLYQAQGDAGSAERTGLRLAQLETRLALKAPLTW
jgi:hypothetical protein